MPASADDLKSIVVSANAFMEQITNVEAVERAQTALTPNADDTTQSRIQNRRPSQFFLSPSEEAVRAMDKKKKHVFQFSGSGEIVETLSPNNTVFRCYIKVDTTNGTSYTSTTITHSIKCLKISRLH